MAEGGWKGGVVAEGGWRVKVIVDGGGGKGVAADIIDAGGHGLRSNILQGLACVSDWGLNDLMSNLSSESKSSVKSLFNSSDCSLRISLNPVCTMI